MLTTSEPARMRIILNEEITTTLRMNVENLVFIFRITRTERTNGVAELELESKTRTKSKKITTRSGMSQTA